MLSLSSYGSTEEILARLQESEYVFTLTGSRRFGQATVFSDWDFYTTFSPEVALFLRHMGFKIKENSLYFDSMTELVMDREAVTVQLVKPSMVKAKDSIQGILLSNVWFCQASKEVRTKVWRTMAEFASKQRVKFEIESPT